MKRLTMLGLLLWAAAASWAGSARDDLVALRASLAAQRMLGRASGWAAELKFAADHRSDPALAAEVLYDVAVSQRENDRSLAAKTLETLLETHPTVQPWAALATCELAQLYGERSATQPKAIELYGKFLKLNHPDPVRQAGASLGLARLCLAASKPDEAIARYREFIEQFPDRAKLCAEALGSMGLALVERKQPKEAYQAYLKLVKDYPWELEHRRNLLLAVAQAFRTSEDYEGAVAAYEKLLLELPRADARRAQAYMGLAMLHIQQKDNEKAVAVYRRMTADKALGAYYRASAYRQLFDLHRRANDNAGIIRLACELIAAQPSGVQQGNILGELVDALVSEGRVDDALAMANAHYRITYLVSTTAPYGSGSGGSGAASSQEAIMAVVRALKAKEGSLRPANRFIAFVEHGPEGPDGVLGTADDLQDPMAAYRLPADPDRDKLFAAAAQRFVNEPHELGFLYICWDKPDEALRAFRRHYLEAGEPTKLQRAAALVAQAMRALGRPEADVDAFFDFQNFGPNGKDGKPKTADDLKDPILAPRAEPKPVPKK
jgi:tetratricopeptide (TPR) repeat protein